MFLEQFGTIDFQVTSKKILFSPIFDSFDLMVNSCSIFDRKNNFFRFLADVYSLCVAYPEPLADKLYAETKKFLDEHVAATLTKVRSGGEQNLLGNYHDAWEEFSR